MATPSFGNTSEKQESERSRPVEPLPEPLAGESFDGFKARVAALSEHGDAGEPKTDLERLLAEEFEVASERRDVPGVTVHREDVADLKRKFVDGEEP